MTCARIEVPPSVPVDLASLLPSVEVSRNWDAYFQHAVDLDLIAFVDEEVVARVPRRAG